MPPRYAYWTILVDGQPTAFRAAMQEELLPTFKRLKEKHASAEMKWFQNGKLWDSRVDAQEAMRERGERGRMGDSRQGGFRDRAREPHRERVLSERSESKGERRPRRERLEWAPKSQAPSPKSQEKLEWKPKGEFTPAPKRDRTERSDRPEWKPKGAPRGKSSGRPPRSFNRDDRKSEWNPKPTSDRGRNPNWRSRESVPRTQDSRPPRDGKLEWTPKNRNRNRNPNPNPNRTRPVTSNPEPGSAKRRWLPKEEYRKAIGAERPRDSKWRPGGDHRDPKQKYKDAKKAKWTKFKKDIRQRWVKKQGRKKDDDK